MSEYKLIVFDMDGTLLNSRKRVSDENLRAIREAVSAGKTVAFGTGRALVEMEDFFPLIPEIRYAVLCSGAGIYDIRERRYLKLSPLSPEIVRGIAAVSRHRDMMIQVVTPYADTVSYRLLEQMERYHMAVYTDMYRRVMTGVADAADFADETDEPVLKIDLYHAEPDTRPLTLEEVRVFPVETVYSEVSSVECSPEGVNKGSGLTDLCALLGISPSEAIAVGDAENDIPMIRTAGLGVAMGNAKPQVLEAADATAPDCDQDGCAWVIRNYLL